MNPESFTLWKFKGLEEDQLFVVVDTNGSRVLVKKWGVQEEPTDWDIADFQANFESYMEE